MGGLFGGGSSKTVPLPPTPSLVPEATSVSRAEVSDSASIIAQMEETSRRRKGFGSTVRSGAFAGGTADKKQKLGE